MIDHNDQSAGRREGERRRDNALALLAARRERYVRQGQRVALLTLLDGVEVVSADEVRQGVALPEDIDPRCLGSVPRPLAMAGILRHDGFTRSCRPERHASIISRWRLADRRAAEQWLDAHPELPEPALPEDHEKSRSTVAPVERLENESPTTQEGNSNGTTL